MKDILLPVVIGAIGISSIAYAAYTNLDYKGYKDVHSCYGECYEEYTAKYGTFSEQ